MPRKRNALMERPDETIRLERKLKVFRQWLAAERDARRFRDELRSRKWNILYMMRREEAERRAARMTRAR
jgi:hypothetical protein